MGSACNTVDETSFEVSSGDDLRGTEGNTRSRWVNTRGAAPGTGGRGAKGSTVLGVTSSATSGPSETIVSETAFDPARTFKRQVHGGIQGLQAFQRQTVPTSHLLSRLTLADPVLSGALDR